MRRWVSVGSGPRGKGRQALGGKNTLHLGLWAGQFHFSPLNTFGLEKLRYSRGSTPCAFRLAPAPYLFHAEDTHPV